MKLFYRWDTAARDTAAREIADAVDSLIDDRQKSWCMDEIKTLKEKVQKIESELKVMKCDHPIIKREMETGFPIPKYNYFEKCSICEEILDFHQGEDAMKKRQREIDLELSEYYRPNTTAKKRRGSYENSVTSFDGFKFYHGYSKPIFRRGCICDGCLCNYCHDRTAHGAIV